jgi:hypothetical protein
MVPDPKLSWRPASVSHGFFTDPLGVQPGAAWRWLCLDRVVNIKLLLSVFAAACFLFGMWSTGSAQLASGPLPGQQSPVAISPIPRSPVVISPVPPAGAPNAGGISASIITPSTTNRLAPNFRSAGRGLPGMPGGPPLSSPLGARDPQPPTVGPLFCDPVVDFPC